MCLQNCQKRRTRRSFETLINIRRHAIDDIARSALHQHLTRLHIDLLVNCFFNQSICVLLTKLGVFCRSVRLQFHADAELTRDLPDGTVSRITAYFHTPSVVVNSGQPLNLQNAITLFNKAVEQFNTRGSGFVLQFIKRFVVWTLRCRSLHGSTYIPTPSFLAAKHCVVNVRNCNDSNRFIRNGSQVAK